MQVHRDIKDLPIFKNAVITIGTFDGVHTGHLQIINQLKKEAANAGGETVIITFDPHPRMIVNNVNTEKVSIKLLNTLSEKIELLQQQEIDHLVIVPFTLEFSEQSAENYIENFLVKNFSPHIIIIGYDHRFGRNRNGDYKLLEAYQAKYNYTVKEIPQHVLHDIIVSSTKIRTAIESGDILTANMHLGYAYFFEGTIVEGNKLGRTIGYPTANIEINDSNKLVPANGVYAVTVMLQTFYGGALKGMMNIGVRPTINGNKKVIEVNIFDFNSSVYNQIIKVNFYHFLRNEVKFDGLDALKNQLSNDKLLALQLLKDI